MLKTWEFGWIKIVGREEIDEKFDNYIRDDILGEWSYYYRPTCNGDIVAVHNWED